MTSFLKRSGMLIISLFISCLVFSNSDTTGMRDITAIEVTAEMAPGINLFNTLDAYGSWLSGLATETAWGQPYTTFEMVQSMAERGFKTLRIPTTWKQHIGPAPDYIIDEEWMNRVETVVNYALDNGMYAILNCHHDDEHFVPTYEKKDEGIQWLESIWTQIAIRFKDYNDYLIFETMNEPREMGVAHEWSNGPEENREVINSFVTASVNAIRATGGNNEKRFLMIQQYGASPTPAKESLVFPNDDPNLIVSIHNYSPYNFCLNNDGTARWGTYTEVNALQNEIKSYADHFIKNGRAVVIGEWGAIDKDNYADKVYYYDVFARASKAAGVAPVLWMYSFDRKNLTWKYPMMEDAIMHAFDSTFVYPTGLSMNVKSDTLNVGETLQLEATVLPDTATSKKVAWTSFKNTVASIDQSGVVTANNSGTTVVTAVTFGQVKEACIIYVVDTITSTSFQIEAENFLEQSGTQTESCSDEGGGENVGYIQNGDWCTYTVDIDSTGLYLFSARVATETAGGSIEIFANNKSVGTVEVDGNKTNGWQDWYTTEPAEIQLEEGHSTFKLTFEGGDGYLFNFNWFKMELTDASNTNSVGELSNEFDLEVYPNPFSNQLNVGYYIDSPSSLKINVFNLHGKLVSTLADEINKPAGKYQTVWSGEGLNNGAYFLQVTINGKSEIRKLFLNK